MIRFVSPHASPFSKPPRLRQLFINLRGLRLLLQPKLRLRQGTQFIDAFALLLDPGVVLLVVPALTVELRAFLHPVARVGFTEDVQPLLRFVPRHFADGLVEARDDGWITVETVGGDGDDVLAFAELERLRGLDRAEDVADGADAERVHECLRYVRLYTGGDEHVGPFLQ